METRAKKRLCFITSTRADWGLLSPVARAMRDSGVVELQIIATNMHLVEKYGMTVDEIERDGFAVSRRVPCHTDGDDDLSRAHVMARCLDGTATALSELKPDAVVILGDRYEMLGAASAAAMLHIPIIHIAGGEISEGALDDCFRHAITKLSTLHLTATEDYRRRVIQLGEHPDSVTDTGAIGVWNALNVKKLSRKELEAFLGLDLTKPTAVVTFHPATNDTASPAEQADAMLAALERFTELQLVITAPNNDAGGEAVMKSLTDFAAAHADRVRFVKSLGMVRYQSLLPLAVAVIGNSSSGIVEAPSAGVPTVDIGIRQRGRTAAPSVIHCHAEENAIAGAIEKALSPEMQALAARRENPYFKKDTLGRMTGRILEFLGELPVPPKSFYDLKQ